VGPFSKQILNYSYPPLLYQRGDEDDSESEDQGECDEDEEDEQLEDDVQQEEEEYENSQVDDG